MNENERYYRRYVLPTWYPPLPIPQGGKRPDIPSLWERAKEMLARALTQLPSARAIASKFWMSRRERREVREWIEPVERLARACIIAKAAIFLLMTPEGRKILHDTPKAGDPAAKKKEMAAARMAPHKVTIPHPGWHTIAQPWRPDPPAQAEAPPADPLDPATWRAAFRTTRWCEGAAESDDGEDKPKRPFNPERLLITIDPDAVTAPRDRKRRRDTAIDHPCIGLARRIEALSRVLADPKAAILRTARFLASFKPEVLREFDAGFSHPGWLHGFRENQEARGHVWRAIMLLANAIQPRPG